MATVTIMDYEAREDLLPPVCLKCGDPATIRLNKKFSWYPRWVIALILINLIVLVVVAMILTKRMTIQAPLCDKHRHHWRNVMIAGIGGFFLFIAIAVVATILGIQMEQMGRAGRDWEPAVIIGGWFVPFVTWLIVVIVFSSTSIRPTQITDDRMTLTGISPLFVDALDNERDEAEEEDERETQRRRQVAREIDDEHRLPAPPTQRRSPAIEDDRIRE